MGYLSQEAVDAMNFRSVGQGVLISDKASIYRPELISLGDHVRIDDFALISPSGDPFSIGSYVHISPFCLLVGKAAIELSDFSGLSGRVTIYSSSDDYSGDHLTNPTIPAAYRLVTSESVFLGKHVIVGTGATLLPGVKIGHYSAVSAMSLVTKSVGEGAIVAGVPARHVKPRNLHLKQLEEKFYRSL